jgi:hypothetical protein
MNTEKTSLENENQPSCLGAVISRYSDADIFKFTDGWWITTYSKQQKRFIKLIGSFKTKDEAKAEIRSLNGL